LKLRERKLRKAGVTVLLAAVLAAGTLTACALPFGTKEEDSKESAGIEAGISKVKLEVGDEEEIEIENYDELRKLDFEVEDEDIATVEEDDDGVYIVTGVSEGKTSVTFTAKDCEDLTIKITVSGGSAATPAGSKVIQLSDSDITLDYSDAPVLLSITNLDEIKGTAADTISISPSEEEYILYYSEFDPDAGGFYLSSYGLGTVTLTVSADGFEPASCTVTCTDANGNISSGSYYISDGMPDYEVLDFYNDEVTLWNHSMQMPVATLYTPEGYTLSDVGGFSEEDDIYYAYFDPESGGDDFITCVSELPMDEWNYITHGDQPYGYTIGNIHRIGTFEDKDVNVMEEDYGEYGIYYIMYYEYYNDANDITDYIGIVVPEVLLKDTGDEALFQLFSTIVARG